MDGSGVLKVGRGVYGCMVDGRMTVLPDSDDDGSEKNSNKNNNDNNKDNESICPGWVMAVVAVMVLRSGG